MSERLPLVEHDEAPAEPRAGVTSVSLLVRPELSKGVTGIPLPSPGRLLSIFIGAIAIGSTAAAVGAYYITLSVTFSSGVLSFFLTLLVGMVGLSVVACYLVHRRITRRLHQWLQGPGEEVDREAWRQALNYPIRMALAVGLAAVVVCTAVATVTGVYADDVALGLHIAVGGLLAALLDAVFAWLYTDYRMGAVLRALAARDPLLPVSGHGVLFLGLAAKMALVIVGVSVVGAVVVGTLAYRGAEAAVASGDISGLAIQLLLVTTVGLGVTLSGCLLVARRVTEPVEELTHMLAELIPERYDVRTLPHNADEAGQLMAAVNRMLEGLEEREFIKDAFSRYVTRQVSDTVLQGGLNLGGELVEVTVLMADIRDFTPMTESLPPKRLVKLLNRYFTAMVEVCVEHGGMIDKFIGDAIMVVFGAPVRLPAEVSALRAARAAVGMRERLITLNESLAAEDLPTLRIGIGVHSGETIAGNIGAPQRLDYTVIGDTVNVCSRIETACKTLKQQILISEVTRDLLGEHAVVSEPYDVHLRGKSQSTRVLALLELDEDPGSGAHEPTTVVGDG